LILRFRLLAGLRLCAGLCLFRRLRVIFARGRLGVFLARRIDRLEHRPIQTVVGLVSLTREDLVESSRAF
jgi:hypothetical protein